MMRNLYSALLAIVLLAPAPMTEAGDVPENLESLAGQLFAGEALRNEALAVLRAG